MKKLIALDIDGTLYNDAHEITPRTKEALIKAQEDGCILILASGRPTAGLVKIAKQLEMDKHHGLLLAYNGGAVTDCSTGDAIYSNAIPMETARQLLKHLEGFPVTPIVDDGFSIYTNDPEGFQIPYESSSNNLEIKQVTNISDSISFSPAKVLIAAQPEVLKANTEELEVQFGDKLSFLLSSPIYLESTPKGVHKGDTLKKVCEILQLDQKDVIAFGDAQNDHSMIEFAGIGVVMGNGCDSLKEIADRITLTNNEDGIAAALEKLL
jgi:Cof subfamily protein (haloacid dehalogenase superfamily)